MEELSIEEKAKAYDKAIGMAKLCLKDGTITNTAISYIETIFPELKESEGEKARKALIAVLKSDFETDNTIYDISVGEIIAWLEKQGEQKSIDPDTLIQQRLDALSDIVAEQNPADKIAPKNNVTFCLPK